jgi:inhibitor of cysteine peptidase
MNGIHRIGIPLLVALFLLAGCGGGDDGAEKVYKDPSQTIEVTVGEEFVISLQSNATTGYSWQLASPLDEDTVQLVASEYIPEPGAEEREGAGGVEEWTFEAAGKGSTVISLKYVRSWEEEEEEAETTDFSVEVI